jgi:hypothetical protein
VRLSEGVKFVRSSNERPVRSTAREPALFRRPAQTDGPDRSSDPTLNESAALTRNECRYDRVPTSRRTALPSAHSNKIAMKNPSLQIPGVAVARSVAEDGMPTTAYPRLFRIFIGSIVAAALCGLAALVVDGSRGLHPAPFLALATLSAIAAACAFLAMLMRLLTEAAVLWWKR